ncbi:hypothetical protein [Neobacillus cucumis]|uniref:hypothetical protein n=1 Tax=Neobacillus cucumis TaxID=1740721 RepID=UPI000C766A85|nr:hypothetical protein [Neobacillus cucumis]
MKLKSMSLIVICMSIFLSACSIKLKTKEVESAKYTSIGNELSVFGFGIGENIHNIEDIIQTPVEKKGALYAFPDEKLTVYVDHQISQYIITTNPKFRLSKKITIGTTKERVLSKLKDIGVYEYKPKDQQMSFLFFQMNDQKVALGVTNDKVEKIMIGNKLVPFEQMVTNIPVEEDQVQDADDQFIAQSNLLTFSVNFTKNNHKVLSTKFLDFAKMGLLEGVPAPIGMDKNDLLYKYGQPNFVFKGKGKVDVYYYYKRFNSYMGFTKENKIVELRLPVDVSYQELKERGIPVGEKVTYGDYTLQVAGSNNLADEISISKKGLAD